MIAALWNTWGVGFGIGFLTGTICGTILITFSSGWAQDLHRKAKGEIDE